MKKAFIAALVAAMFGATAMASGADMLIWHIDLEDSWVYQNGNYPTFNKITLGLQNGSDSSTYQELDSKTYYLVDDTTLASSPGYGGGLADASQGKGIAGNFATDLSAYGNDVYGGYEVMIQLWNNNELVAVSDNIFDSSKNLYLSSLARTSMPTDTLPASAWEIGINFGGRMVPEPTSGLLMMLGAGLLALRRRRRA